MIGIICVGTYYCSLMALTLFYLINSFTSDLPWAHCRDEWKTNRIMDNYKKCVASDDDGKGSLENDTVSSSELYFR